MDKQTWKTAAISSLLTFLALLGGLGCMASGMDLPAELPVLVLGCAVIAVLFSFFWSTRLWLLPLCLSALLWGYWWQEGSLRLSMEGLIYQITELYDRGYGWGILQWTDRNLLSQDTTPALLALGLPIGAVLSLTVTKGRLGWVGTGLALLPLLSCLLLKDTVPAEEYLALLLFAVVMLILTDSVRRRDPRQANRLTMALLLPLTLGLALLFVFCPRETYNGQSGAQKLEELVLSLFEKVELPEGSALIPGDQSRTVNLEDVGKREKDSTVIMTVRAQETGSIYLRGCAYDIYDGTSWSSTPGWNSWNLFYSTGSDTVKSLSIKTRQAHSVLYFTYNPYASEQKVVNGRMRNEDGLTEYTVYYQDAPSYSEEWDGREDAIGGDQLAEYLQLPDPTRQQALDILTHRVGVPTETINAGQVWKNAAYIVNWVSRRAQYDLNTDPMPAGESDFAMWFLNESDTGYCTHYATAAVVLLRAAGIPAQYVTGYLVSAKAGQDVDVTASNAHAWVEVFINGVGWVALEPTPSQGVTQTVGGSESSVTPERPTATQPEQTGTPTGPEQTNGPIGPEQTEISTEPAQTTGEAAGTAAPDETLVSASDPALAETGIAGIGGASPGTPVRQDLGQALLWLPGAVLTLLAVVLQWRLRVWLRQSRLRRGEPNRRALRHWKLLERMCRLAKQAPPEECFWLAQKAKFSQHTLTPQELHTMGQAVKNAELVLRKQNFLSQLLYTVIFAVY